MTDPAAAAAVRRESLEEYSRDLNSTVDIADAAVAAGRECLGSTYC